MWNLILFSLAMFGGCYFAGCIPLAIEMSDRKLRLITILGAGLLVGTSLSVIIPEGVHTIYQSSSSSSSQHGGHIPDDAAQSLNHLNNINRKPSQVKDSGGGSVDVGGSQKLIIPQQPPQGVPHHGHDVIVEDKLSVLTSSSAYGITEPHKWIGFALVMGFVTMLLIDHKVSKSSQNFLIANIANSGGAGCSRANIVSLDSTGGIGSESSKSTNATAASVTFGLMMHAFADGIALGAASNVSQLRVEAIVFIAIMVHKGPAAFALVTYLLHEGMERWRIRKCLLAFSSAAPLAALFSYFVLSTFHSSSYAAAAAAMENNNAIVTADAPTGFVLLFSAGTFLYVSTIHILSELGPARFRWDELVIWIGGAWLPLMLTMLYSHS